MKKIWIILTMALLVASCNEHEPGSDTISLDKQWKFKTGDNPDWALPNFNDSNWETISNRAIWERQGFDKYNGYAWYRLRVFIPSSLKKRSYFKDSLQLILGKIDDTDQTFLNGQPLGSNNRTVYDPEAGFPLPFEGDSEAYNYERRYALGADDPRIRWDQENLIAIRVHDHGGGGGIKNPNPTLSMVDLKDFIEFDIKSTPFNISNNHFSKTITISNHLDSEDLSGILNILVIEPYTGDVIYDNSEEIVLNSNSGFEHIFNFDAPESLAYTISYSFLAAGAKNPVYVQQDAPYILTPEAPLYPRINGPDIYGAGHGAPFLYKIPATGERPLRFSAEGLPNGLILNEENGLITGTAYRAGEYDVVITATNKQGKDEKILRLSIGDKTALTPPLGWNSWNVWGLSVDDGKVRDAARMMAESGLADYGWTYVNIDDGWEAAERTSRGELLSNAKFPDMNALADYVHSLGLKLGIYSSPGPETCGGYLGSYEHEYQDARTWARWGIDFLKHDWCSYRTIAKDSSIEELQKPYLVMREALDRVNRDIVYSLCQYGMGNVWEWGKEVGGNMWRTTGDITDTWESMSTIGFNEHRSSKYAEPGHWNDVDMMVVGWVGWGPDLHLTRLTPDEQYTHVSLWSLLASPMLLGCDLTRLDDFTLNLLTNTEVLAIHQDTLGVQANKVLDRDNLQVWVKELADGSKAVGFFNLGDDRIKREVNFSDFNMNDSYTIRDSWRQEDISTNASSLEINIPSHGVLLTRFR